MNKKTTIAITGAAGNLGSILAQYIVHDDIMLHLLIHRKDVPTSLKQLDNVQVFRVDLNQVDSLHQALDGVDTVIHFAGVLFQASPQSFLPKTNVEYFKNLLDAARQAQVKRMILVSFPHVEGESFPDCPAKGSLEGEPSSVHASTRLKEEQLLLSEQEMESIILRVGMVYGKGILMIEAARFFSRFALLGVWKHPTYIHLISKDDFLAATRAALYLPHARGIYHIGDEGVQTLQEFLHEATRYWKTHSPWTMPLWMIYSAATIFETWSRITGCRSPLTRDFVTIGRASYYGDTTRMKEDLLPVLAYPSFRDGIHTL